MSKGMWTKQFSASGKVFYFNATQNLSVWHAPPDSIVHEAPNLKSPLELREETLKQPGESLSSISNGFQTQVNPSYVLDQQTQFATNYNNYSENIANRLSTDTTNNANSIERSIQEKMNEAVNRSQKDSAGKNRRVSDNATASSSAYLAQKNEYVRQTGSRSEEGSNWYVR